MLTEESSHVFNGISE